MSKSCDDFRNEIMDVVYEEKKMYDGLRKHIETCEDCSSYYKELNEIKLELDCFQEEPPIDYISISQVLDEAESIHNRKNNIVNLVLFVLTASVVLTIISLAAFNGYFKEIIYFEIASYTVLPILLPIIIKKRFNKEVI